jgi:hypothetical protein
MQKWMLLRATKFSDNVEFNWNNIMEADAIYGESRKYWTQHVQIEASTAYRSR